MSLSARLDALFAGGLTRLEPEGQLSGICKQPVTGPIWVAALGLAGDEQADRRVHGGPEKAVHQYAAEHYARLAQAFAEPATAFVAGSLGENLSLHGLTEETVYIGDIYRAGAALLQVSQPRSPCWKINHRFGLPRLSRFIADARITGWYYRVLEPGWIAPGDSITLMERQPGSGSIDAFWQIQMMHRPDPAALAQLLAAPGLAPEWQQRLATRQAWLSRQLAARA